jgi:sugar phosphate isomerase/epimerase
MPAARGSAHSERDSGGKVSRRRFLGVGAGAAAGLAIGVAGAENWKQDSQDEAGRADGGLIPADRRGLQLYSVRDAVGRAPHEYPTQPSGYRQVFEALAEIGYANVEAFAHGDRPFLQHPEAEGGAEPSPRLIKRWLDEYGLRSSGHYGSIRPSTIDATLRLAETLEMPLVGSVDPIPYPCSNQKVAWDKAIEEWNICAGKAAARGIQIYAHAHWRPWDFLRDRGQRNAIGDYTRSSGIRSMEYWLDNTDPSWVALEMDTYWAYVARSLYDRYMGPDGTTHHAVFDPIATALKYIDRCIVFHAKDGVVSAAPPEGFEGDYTWTTFGTGDMPLEEFFRAVVKKWPRPVIPYLNVEQDNGPAGVGESLAEPISDPQKSLRDAGTSYLGLSRMSA